MSLLHLHVETELKHKLFPIAISVKLLLGIQQSLFTGVYLRFYYDQLGTSSLIFQFIGSGSISVKRFNDLIN